VLARALSSAPNPQQIIASGEVRDVTITPGVVTAVAVPTAAPVTSLSGPTSATGGDSVNFSWSIRAPGFRPQGDMTSLAWRRSDSSSGTQSVVAVANRTGDEYRATAGFRTPQTPGELLVWAGMSESLMFRDLQGMTCNTNWGMLSGSSPPHRLQIQ
jgi:hypothetical protein